MKAVVLNEENNLELKVIQDPQPDKGGLIIKVETCAICGTDVKIRKYGYASANYPLILGHELAGTVVELGDGVDNFAVGDRVTVNPNIPCGVCFYCQRGMQTACDNLVILGVHLNGAFAEYVKIPPQSIKQGCVFRIPAHITNEEAALIDPASCAINACELSGVKADDTVVVIGAGPAGCLNVEVSKVFGAGKTILVQRSQQRLVQAAFTGADVYINSTEEEALKRIFEETDGRGADVVIVACASAEAQQQALEMVAKRGNVNLFGGLPKGSPSVQFDSNSIHYKESYVIGTHGGSNRHCGIALHMIASGRIKAKEYISAKVGLADFLKAFQLAEEKKGIKIFINPNE
jgi:L-iditol 2-dehydrogenase